MNLEEPELGVSRAVLLRRLRRAGLRPTRPRIELARLLFGRGHRHISVEQIQTEAATSDVIVSLATIYNVVNRFTEVGLLREVKVDGARTFFDTNTSAHHHFYVEDEERVIDVPAEHLKVGEAPPAPEGYEVIGMDVVVRLRRVAPEG